MSLRTYPSKHERETILRWDESDDPAVLWKASPSVHNEWRSMGFPVVKALGGGWCCEVSKDRVMYRVFKKTPSNP